MASTAPLAQEADEVAVHHLLQDRSCPTSNTNNSKCRGGMEVPTVVTREEMTIEGLEAVMDGGSVGPEVEVEVMIEAVEDMIGVVTMVGEAMIVEDSTEVEVVMADDEWLY
jgi:hypothetical protein